MDSEDTSAKLSNILSSLTHHHLKRPRHYYKHQYSRRNSGKHSNATASTSHGKSTLCGEKLSFKLSDYPENKEQASKRPNRTRSSSLVMDPVKNMCGICQKLLRRKPYCLRDPLSSGEYAAVAVLVCGHLYHAECLEKRTNLEDSHDPPCPSCSGLLSQDVSKG